jgi:outer membrane lipoprotein-sorting protein
MTHQSPKTRAGRLLRTVAAASIALGAIAVAGTVYEPVRAIAPAAAASEAAQRIADHFSSFKTMTGEFVQFGPRGEQTGGTFHIQRPGKVRFDYEAPSDYRVISDGDSVVIDNQKMRTADLYPLSKTPLKLLLDERIDLSGNRVTGVSEEADLTTIRMADRSVFGNATITMMFDPQSFELRQWTITDG